MKQKKLVITFTDENGNKVDVLSKDSARHEDVFAALNFLDLGRILTVSVVEFNYENNG